MYKRAIAINTFAQIIGKIFSLLLNLVILYLLAHHFSLNEYGEYTAAFSFLLIFNVLADLGLSTILVRDVFGYKEEEKPKFIGNVIIIRLLSLVVSLSIGVIIGFLIPQYDYVIKLGILLGSGSTFALLLSTLLFSVFQMHLKLQKSVYSNALGVIVNFLIVLLVIKYRLSIDIAVLSVTLGYIAMLIMAYVQVSRLQKIEFSIDINLWKKILPQSLTIGGMIIFSSIYFKADSLILSLMKPYYVVSLYGVPYKVLEVLIGIPQMFMAPIFAIMSTQFSENNMEGFKKLFQETFNVLVLASLPIIPGAYFLSSKVFPILGSKYIPSVDIFKVLSIAIFLSFIGSSLIFVILLLKKQTYLLVWNIFLSIFNIVLNIIFIPKYSYFAAAWLTVATEILVLSGSTFFVWKSLKYLPNINIFFKGLIATIAFTLSLIVLSNVSLIIQSLISFLIYLAALFALKAFSIQDIKDILHKDELY